MITHPFPPLYDENSRVLILGSFPSAASRSQMFFYGHKRNRFWSVMARILECPLPETVGEKKNMLHSHHIALWDTIASCEIRGSADSSIKSVTPNDLSLILESADIRRIFTNGRTSGKYYDKYIRPLIGRETVCLPSTSPANAAWSEEALFEEWRVIREYL